MGGGGRRKGAMNPITSEIEMSSKKINNSSGCTDRILDTLHCHGDTTTRHCNHHDDSIMCDN